MASKKKLVTEADVPRMASGTRELILGSERIATPAALDLAFSRGMKVIYAEADSASPLPSDLWSRIKSRDGTYVVQVESGRATVTRLGPAGPEPIGGE